MLTRLALIAIGFLPYVVKLPYLTNAWRYSRLDTPDLVFLPAAMVLVVVGARRGRFSERLVMSALPVLALAVVGFVAACGLRINALQVASAVAVAWGTWWLAAGRLSAFAVLPGFVVLLLTTSSVTYWVCNFSGLDVGMVRFAKVMLAVGAALSLNPKMRRVLAVPAFVSLAALIFYSYRSGDLMREGDPFIPSFVAKSTADRIAREQETGDGFRRFFGTSKARQIAYATPSNTVTVLAVEIGENVHEVHPATHCLRTSGWTVHSEELREVNLDGIRLSLSEALVSHGGGPVLSWTWYSDSIRSTGSFFCFRRHAGEPGWHTFQLRTSAAAGVNSARSVLESFVRSETLLRKK